AANMLAERVLVRPKKVGGAFADHRPWQIPVGFLEVSALLERNSHRLPIVRRREPEVCLSVLKYGPLRLIGVLQRIHPGLSAKGQLTDRANHLHARYLSQLPRHLLDEARPNPSPILRR